MGRGAVVAALVWVAGCAAGWEGPTDAERHVVSAVVDAYAVRVGPVPATCATWVTDELVWEHLDPAAGPGTPCGSDSVGCYAPAWGAGHDPRMYIQGDLYVDGEVTDAELREVVAHETLHALGDCMLGWTDPGHRTAVWWGPDSVLADVL